MPGSLVRSPGQTDMGDRSGAASLVQKQIEQIEHSDDDRDRGSMVLVLTTAVFYFPDPILRACR